MSEGAQFPAAAAPIASPPRVRLLAGLGLDGGDMVLLRMAGGAFGLDRGEARALAHDILAALGAPTEAMLDAPRGLFLYFGSYPGGMTLGEHLAAGGWPTAGLTPEQLAHCGSFPKAERAGMVWAMMTAEGAARRTQDHPPSHAPMSPRQVALTRLPRWRRWWRLYRTLRDLSASRATAGRAAWRLSR